MRKIQPSTYRARERGVCGECRREYEVGDWIGDLRKAAGHVHESCWEDADESDRE